MAKLTREQKIEIFQKYQNGISIINLSVEYNIRLTNMNYLIRLLSKHGIEVLRNGTNKYYSPKLKEEIINKVLFENNSVNSIAIEYGLSSNGILFNWIKSYKENNYVIVEKTRGRPPTMTVKNIEKKYEDMSDQEKIRYLEKKNEYLEAEIEYRKKLKAVVQARQQREQKKK